MNYEDCTDLDQLVQYINASTEYAPEQIAARYALDCCDDAGYGNSDEQIEAHLDTLAEAGAEFDRHEALLMASHHASMSAA